MDRLLSPISPGGPAYARYLYGLEVPYKGVASFPFGTIGRVFLTPIDIPWSVVMDRIIYQVGGVSAGNVRLGIYRQGTTADSPLGASVVVESASVAQSPASNIQIVTITDTLLVPGQYFLGIQGSDVLGTFAHSYDAGTLIGWYYDRGGGYGAFTSPCPALTANDRLIGFMLRVKTNLGL